MTIQRVAGLIDRRRRVRIGREGRKIIAGVLLIAAVLFGQSIAGAATSWDRLDPSLRGATGLSNVVVVLDFTPERFHNERLASYGVFAGRDGSVRRIRLRMVSPKNLSALGNLIWVSRVEPLAVRAPAPPKTKG